MSKTKRGAYWESLASGVICLLVELGNTLCYFLFITKWRSGLYSKTSLLTVRFSLSDSDLYLLKRCRDSPATLDLSFVSRILVFFFFIICKATVLSIFLYVGLCTNIYSFLVLTSLLSLGAGRTLLSRWSNWTGWQESSQDAAEWLNKSQLYKADSLYSSYHSASHFFRAICKILVWAGIHSKEIER